MGSDAKRSFGAVGRDDLLFFDPEDLVIVTDPDHPLYDERAFLPPKEQTILSIMEVGVLEPIIVRKNGEDENKKPIVEVVDGRGRTKAARIANHRLAELGRPPVRVPGVRRRGDPVELMGVMISTNEIRYADSPLIKARKIARYMNLGRTIEDCAVVFGTSTTTLKSYLAIIDCHADVQKALERGRIGISHAKKLSAFPQEQQSAELEKILAAPATAGGEPAEPSEGDINDRLEKALGGRGKLRQRKLKTQKDLKVFRKSLNDSRSADAPLAAAILDFILGNESALDKFRAIKNAFTKSNEDVEEE